MTTTNTTSKKAVRNLIVGDGVLSASGKTLTVTNIVPKENRTIVLFDGDMEVDMDPYMEITVIESEKVSKLP